jgi:hypothetical protein
MPTFITQENHYNDENEESYEQNYKIISKLRSGGFGDVYRGRRCFDNLAIALKVIQKVKIKKWTKVREKEKEKELIVSPFLMID